jgi:tRNA A37 methylthiotransferase MiaB
MHIFRYSSRVSTLAFQKEKGWGKVSEQIKKKRAKQLAELEKELRHQFWQSQIGKTATARVWNKNKGMSDNYIPIRLKKDSQAGIFSVKITGAEDSFVFAKIS